MADLLFSGVQPTNNLHIGNYIGALKQWVDIQHRYRCMFCVVDLHAITVPQDPKKLRENVLNAAAAYLAVGIDPKRCNIFVQSEVPQHAELGWMLQTITKIAELERMTQFKDKSKKQGEGVGTGLFTYPALMAADILLYDTTVVPVGEDQMQHVELTRTLARRFNAQFGETFTVPQALIQKMGARIMGLDDPKAKMSKSGSVASYIALSDDPDTIRKKIMRAVTDSGKGISFDAEKRPAISNLMTIYHHATGKTLKEIETEFDGKGYGDFKKALADAVVTMLAPIQAQLKEYKDDPGELSKILDKGAEAASALAEKKMKAVRERMGLGRT
ncbi:MAG: tryptophan--tRNA ligase [Patescibacteria group bacterium]